MISLKKFLDSASVDSKSADVARHGDAKKPAGALKRTSPPGNLLSAYLATLAAIGTHGQRAVPSLGDMIGSALAGIADTLAQASSPDAIRDSSRLVEEQLSQWADSAQQKHKEGEKTIRDLLQVIFEATESTGTRDEKFTREIGELGDRLRTVAGLESVPLIRRSITENASALTSCVARMADESRESVRKLTSEIAEYQTRLMASERRALVDPLTGLCNRRGFEEELELRVQRRQPFSLLVADLNGFKSANDRHGHLVGDEILRQFALELKSQFVADDMVARWGGDEFVGIVAGAPNDGAIREERVRHWVLGEYKIAIENRTISVMVDAALGTTAWDGVESGLELLARADKEMYREKQHSRQPA